VTERRQSNAITTEQARVAITCPKCGGEMIRESYEGTSYDDPLPDPFAWYWTCVDCGHDADGSE
jgi:predicted RNA-binding Zn-ribbon protein involved in translation (DUF1610 family)